MEGLLLVSLDSGLLLYASKPFEPFLFNKTYITDEMQLSAMLFALYKTAAPAQEKIDNEDIEGTHEVCIKVNKPAISWIHQVPNHLKCIICTHDFINRERNGGTFLILLILHERLLWSRTLLCWSLDALVTLSVSVGRMQFYP